MYNKILGELVFNNSWLKNETILLYGNHINILIILTAYSEEEKITIEQENAYLDFTKNKTQRLITIERLLNNFSESSKEQYIPRFLLIGKNGEYAFLFDDNADPDDGIAVCIYPEEKIISQNEYL